MMGRAAWVVVIAVAHSRVGGAAPCTPIDKATATEDATKKANEGRFTKALAARKLKPIVLTKVGLPYDDENAGQSPVGFAVDRVVDAEDRGSKVSVVTSLSSSCGDGPRDFVQTGSKIYRVVRTPKPGKASIIKVCGCPSPRFTCGGARVVSRPIGFVLPAGTTFAGTTEIAYVTDEVSVEKATTCPIISPPP